MIKPNKNQPREATSLHFPVVGIGASAGGLEAFKRFLSAIDEKSGMAYVVVQHLDPSRDSILPELLSKVTNIPVHVIKNNTPIAPDNIYVIPSNTLVTSSDGVLQLDPREESKEVILPIDLFFITLAEVHGEHAVGVILSGTGSDGTIGLKAIKAHGGITFAQDNASAAYDGMPESAIGADVVDFVLPPEKIPPQLMELTGTFSGKDRSGEKGVQQKEADDEVFRQILLLIKSSKGLDFAHYKQATIRRRIMRRMAFHKNKQPADYLRYLQDNTVEQEALFQDLLIPVTEFFRDPETFEHLSHIIIPLIDKQNLENKPIRIWVAGCSTGQEAYSIAICVQEYLDDEMRLNKKLEHLLLSKNSRNGPGLKVQIFATDISDDAIHKARMGVYQKSQLEGVSPLRLQKYFTRQDGGAYQINKLLRDMCIFARHDMIKDPPFAKMDLISCRNVLIYMTTVLQTRLLNIFHYALKEKSFLLLGKSETIGSSSSIFAAFGKENKIYVRKPGIGRFIRVASELKEETFKNHNLLARKNLGLAEDYQKVADDILLSNYTPAGVVVNEQADIVHFRGGTGLFLEPMPGKATLNLFKMSKENLSFELRNALYKAKSSNEPVIKDGIEMILEGVPQSVTIEVIPLPELLEPHYLILFRNTLLKENELKALDPELTAEGKLKMDLKDLRILQLEKELEHERRDMMLITEDQEAANEELQSANEELLSSSEELQSVNEELETSKDQLLGINEQLVILNDELLKRNEQLNDLRKYSEAIVNTLHEPLLILDKGLRVKAANPAFFKVFKVTEDETVGLVLYEIGNKQWDIPGLRNMFENVDKTMVSLEINHSFPSLGQRTLLLNARQIYQENLDEQLTLLTIEDVTENRNANQMIKESYELLKSTFEDAFIGVGILNLNGDFIQVNKAYCETTGYSEEEMLSKSLQSLNHPADIERNAKGMDDLLKGVIPGFVIEKRYVRKDGETVWVRNSVSLLKDSQGNPAGYIAICYNTTEERLARQKAEESTERFRFLADRIPQQIWTAGPGGNMNYFNQAVFNYSGLNYDQMKDVNWEKLVHPDDLEKNRLHWEESIQTGKDIIVEHRFIRHDGEYRWHLSRASAQKDIDGNVLLWVGSSTDINDQKSMEEELEKRVQERTQALLEANASLENSNNNLEQFAYIASHDLKEPLRKIRTYSTWLNVHFSMSEEAKEYVEKIAGSVERMSSLIDDLLNFYLLLRPDVEMKVTNLNIVLNSVISDFNLLIAQKNAVLHVGDLPTIEAIPIQMNQLFHNLLSNALKFTKDNISPVISISSRMLAADEIKLHSLNQQLTYFEIIVQDNGIGFDQEFAERIFVIFQRLNSRQKFSGTGIGLALAQKIVMNHNGLIFANSEQHKGATFHIILPLQTSY